MNLPRQTLRSMRMRAASFRRELGRNPVIKRVLGNREISAHTLLMAMHYLDNQPVNLQRSNLLGSINTLQWLAEKIEARARFKIVSTRTAMEKELAGANAHFRQGALDEFTRLFGVMISVMNGDPVSDPLGTLTDLLMLKGIIDEYDKLEAKMNFRDALANGANDSAEHKALSRAISKSNGDRAKAIKKICRLYGVKDLAALPEAVKGFLRSALP